MMSISFHLIDSTDDLADELYEVQCNRPTETWGDFTKRFYEQTIENIVRDFEKDYVGFLFMLATLPSLQCFISLYRVRH